MNVRRIMLAAAGAALATGALAAARRAPGASALDRTNHRGHTVSLTAGPALAVAAATTAAAGAASGPAAAAALVAGLGAGAVGLYDDVVGQRPDQKTAKGFRGHLGALREGRLTSGLVKILGIGAAGLAASALLGRPSTRRESGARGGRQAVPGAGRGAAAAGGRPSVVGTAVDVALGAGVIAGAANLANLLDLRPGRALKAGLIVAAPLAVGPAGGLVAGPAGAAAALLPADLDERVMLGDGGANALGALLGVAACARTGRTGRAVLLAALAGLTLASEKVSFTKVIEATPVLRELDALGRRRPTPRHAEGGQPPVPAE